MRFALAAGCCVALLGSCLPHAEAPVGTRVMPERGLAGVGFSRGGQAPGTWLLFSRAGELEPGDDDTDTSRPPPRDLYAMPRAGGEARRLATHVVPTSGSPQWDALGRLHVQHHQETVPGDRGPPARTVQLTRFDLASGETIELGRVRTARLSPAARRLYYEASDGTAMVREADERERPLGAGIREVRFLGEDLVYLSGMELRLCGPDGQEPRLLLDKVKWWRPVAADGTRRRVLVTRSAPKGAQIAYLYPDVVAGMPELRSINEVALLGDPVPSRDGQAIAYVELLQPGLAALTVMQAGQWRSEPFELPPAPMSRRPMAGDGPLVEIELRPGSAEVWAFVNERLHVLRPDAGLLVVPDGRHSRVRIGRDDGFGSLLESAPEPTRTVRPSIFTADGRRWLFETAAGRFVLGDADDPLADQGLVLGDAQNTPTRNLAELDGGRRLALWLAPGSDRTDLHLVDVGTLERRLLATDMTQVTFGQKRALVVARVLGHRSFAPGDLSLVDLDGGGETRLGQNVSEFAIEPVCSRCDVTGAGVTAAFVVQARIPFEYDGLYLAELP